jgi:hypothetical protein
LAPIIKARRESKADVGQTPFLWLAPSDPYWGKSSNLQVRVSEILSMASTKEKRLYSPTIYLPVSGPDDQKTARQWKWEFDPNTDKVYGLIEGFLGGNVEVMHFEGEFVVVVYHVSLPDSYPVSLPIGFISADKDVVSSVGRLITTYLEGSSGFERPNDCGLLATEAGLAHRQKRKRPEQSLTFEWGWNVATTATSRTPTAFRPWG